MTYNVNDIIHEARNQKKSPHWLDKLPSTKNKARGLPADHPTKINRFLPSKQAEAKKLDELSQVFNTTSRAGAGGTRLGVPGIRPSGGKAASAFLDNFTGIGRYKQQAAPFTQNTPLTPTSQNPNARQVSVALYHNCLDCMQPVSKDDCVPNITPAAHQKYQTVGLKPDDLIGYLFCGTCIRAAVAIAKDPSKQLRLIKNGQEVSLAKLILEERSHRISDQVFAEIQKERNNPDSDAFYGNARTL